MAIKTTKRDIGLAVKSIRLKLGLKQIVLAKKINPKATSAGTISRIERGNSNYTIDYLFQLAEILECDISDFCSNNKRDPGVELFEKFLEALKEQVLKEAKKEK